MIKQELRRDLGYWGAVAMVVGTVIGSGIFAVPKAMVLHVGTPAEVFAVWIFGGILSLFGALTYAELAAAMPEAGGEYVYLRTAYGPFYRVYLWMDAGMGSQERFDRYTCHAIFLLPGQLRPGARTSLVHDSTADRPEWRAVRSAARAILRDGGYLDPRCRKSFSEFALAAGFRLR